MSGYQGLPMPPWIPAPSIPSDARYLLHFRRFTGGLTACGAIGGCSTISPTKVECRECLAVMGVDIDDRTPQQKDSDLAGYLWRSLG